MTTVLPVEEPSAKYIVQEQRALVRGLELLTTAGGGVAKLRDFVLALAVRGRLVQQLHGEIPIASLVQRTQVNPPNDGGHRLRKMRGTDEDFGDRITFKPPQGWKWVSLSEVTHDWGQKTPSSSFTYIDVSSVDNERGVIADHPQVIDRAAAPSRARKIVKRGTVIFSTVRPYLKNIAIVDSDYQPEPIASTAFAILHPTEVLDPRYLTYWLRSDVFTAFVASKAVGVAYPAINDRNFFEGLIALPPLGEQHRIVARVEELMKLCDALEQNGRLADEQHARLTSTLFGALAASESAHALAENWQRVAEHFDLLLDRPGAIDALEQTILELAARGLLVQQDPADEPATALLRRIAAERRRLLGRRAKDGSLLGREDQLAPFPLPDGWTWAPWDSVALQIGDIDHKMPREAADGIPYVSPKDFTDGNGIDFARAKKISEVDFEELASKIRPERGDLIYPRYGTIGKVRLVETDQFFLASYSCAVIKCMSCLVDPKYQFFVSISALIADQAAAATNKTTQPNVGLKSIKSFLFPLPPLTEQHRIVARVEELRGICAQLRERLTAARRTQSQLADALVVQAVG